jgi:2',3'-cyclic-nucleotide 2'-phosphodiesterase (5'-nucleotidase family)
MSLFTSPPRFVPFFVFATIAGCGSTAGTSPPQHQDKPSPTSSASQVVTAPQPPVEVTLLYTTDEHGWLESLARDGVMRGGVAAFSGQLAKVEGHCPGPAPFAINQDESFMSPHSENCTNPKTLLLSGGDNYTGPAISTYYLGEPMAESMGRLGYAASAFGNHEFDFGKAQFPKNRDKAKMRYLAANVRIDDPNLAKELDIHPYEIFERRGIRIGVIGLSTVETLKTAIAERFVGIAFEPVEGALERTVPKVWDAGADVVVVIGHECPDILVPTFANHPEWKLAFVGGGHCHKKMHEYAGEVSVMSPDWRMHQYARVTLKVDRSLPAKSRVISVKPEFVDVVASPQVSPDPVLTELVKVWKEKVDKALGGTIGFSKGGIGPEAFVGQLVANAWLAQVGGDVALANKGGIRQTIPAGPITYATLWGVLPFDNRLMKLSVAGEDLVKELENNKFIAAGAEKKADGTWLIGGKKLDKKKRYTVLLTDFMYTGGDGSLFAQYDPHGIGTGIQWRDPVIAWIEKQKTTASAPLEDKLPKRAATP